MFCFDYHGDFDRSVLQIHNTHIRHVFQYLLQIIRRTVQFQLTSLNLGEKKNGIYQLQQCISCIFYISDQRTAATFYLSFAKHDIADADNCMQWAPQIMAHACHKAALDTACSSAISLSCAISAVSCFCFVISTADRI